ncbi:MAG: hypothetical protein Q9159_005723 [Coniocarpon cinnabarinum]
MDDDPFDELFNLEDKYYQEGYEQGRRDGAGQSRLGARIFGIEKGYEKYIEMGRIQARARVWSEDLRIAAQTSTDEVRGTSSKVHQTLQDPALRSRLAKHVDVLTALVDPTTLSTQNTDDAVSDFDDRIKRAQAKCKVVERMLRDEGDGVKRSGGSKNPATFKSRLNDF